MQCNDSPGDTPDDSGGDGNEVGYRRPPKHARFKPGQSGNRQGRRKHSKSGKTLLMKALNEQVLVTQGGVSGECDAPLCRDLYRSLRDATFNV